MTNSTTNTKPASSAGWLRFAVCLTILLSTGLYLHSRQRLEVVPMSERVSAFPRQIGEWSVARDIALEPNVLEVLGPGDFLQRIYARNPSTPYIDFFLAYFPSQQTGDTMHSPKNCLPGSGWSFSDSRPFTLDVPGMAPLHINRYIISKGTNRQLVLYWYYAHGRAVGSEYWAKIYLVADAIRMNRTDGSLVRIITPIGQNEEINTAEARVVEFARGAVPHLARFVPD